MRTNLAGCHPARIHRNHLVVEARQPSAVLLDQLGLETAFPVSRHRDLHRAAFGQHPLAVVAVAMVAGTGIPFVLKMRLHLRVQRPFGNRLAQFGEQVTVAERHHRILAA